MISKYLSIAQVIVSILLIIFILLQNRGSGLSSLFGGEGNIYKTKRGAEKIIFILTIILSVSFLGLALINLLTSR
ncbi:MAG: preprotein translocase subunit SecG [Parcubacteria group bacterium Athens1014_10]|nr:MAG: preprotein translocase subunit SecG [Parcubacteria group bacterium Athens1014_10]TSD04685.1 MAG: preprotein translocase subunit SecG [Parcubacteria group bacterium Athens0714_12]